MKSPNATLVLPVLNLTEYVYWGKNQFRIVSLDEGNPGETESEIHERGCLFAWKMAYLRRNFIDHQIIPQSVLRVPDIEAFTLLNGSPNFHSFWLKYHVSDDKYDGLAGIILTGLERAVLESKRNEPTYDVALTTWEIEYWGGVTRFDWVRQDFVKAVFGNGAVSDLIRLSNLSPMVKAWVEMNHFEHLCKVVPAKHWPRWMLKSYLWKNKTK